jgi:hypothetical protein
MNDTWPQIEQHILKLWPSFSRHYNREQANLYKKVLGKLPLEPLIKAIEIHASKSIWVPRPALILETARSFMTNNEVIEEQAQYKADSEASWQQALDRMSKISRQDILLHRQSVLETDWRLQHLRKVPTASKLWISIITMRDEQGIKPTDPQPDVPPCPSHLNSGKNDDNQLGQVMLPLYSDSTPSKHPLTSTDLKSSPRTRNPPAK